jgi:hypothetical protein
MFGALQGAPRGEASTRRSAARHFSCVPPAKNVYVNDPEKKEAFLIFRKGLGFCSAGVPPAVFDARKAENRAPLFHRDKRDACSTAIDRTADKARSSYAPRALQTSGIRGYNGPIV